MMDNRITKVIIVGIIFGVLVMGVILIWSIFNRDSTADRADQILGVNTKEISLEEVKKHSSKDDCWVYLGGVVYDATNVISTNIKYQSILTKACGGDGTNTYTVLKFEEQDLEDTTISKLNNELLNYKVGILAP